MDDVLIAMVCAAPLAIYLAVTKGRGTERARFAAIGLGLAFCYFAMGHFVVTDDLVAMLPPWVPERPLLIQATGCMEAAIALGLFLPQTYRLAAAVAAVVLVLFFPANVYAALNHTGVGDHKLGPVYLWLRAPLQVFLVAWALWPALRPSAKARAEASA